MQRIAQRTFEPAAIQSVIGLQMPDRRLNGLAQAQPALLLRAQALELAAMNDLRTGVVRVHATEPEIDHHLLEDTAHILRYVFRLLQHRDQRFAARPVGLC